MTIPYDIIWVAVGCIALFFVFRFFFEFEDFGFHIFLVIMLAVSLFAFRSFIGFTSEQREKNRIERIEESKPFTTKEPMGDGCTLYRYYPNGTRNNSTYNTKYVKCENASATMYREYSCGTGKIPKTCTEPITTMDNKKND